MGLGGGDHFEPNHRIELSDCYVESHWQSNGFIDGGGWCGTGNCSTFNYNGSYPCEFEDALKAGKKFWAGEDVPSAPINPGELTTNFLPGKAWQWQWASVLLVDGDGIVDMAMVVGEGVQ